MGMCHKISWPMVALRALKATIISTDLVAPNLKFWAHPLVEMWRIACWSSRDVRPGPWDVRDGT